MKKGFTMIELIFVIVILGILASVAIPRLAATREDAEISAAVANLRTLVSDASAYYTANGSFKTNGTTTAKWIAITNVPLENANSTDATTEIKLKAGGKDCIGVKLVEKATATGGATTPAHIKFTKDGTNSSSGVCKTVVESTPVKAYIESQVTKSDGSKESDAIVVGSSTSVYGSK
nr:type II secretion system protein [uncultured Campylobacter sp.]